MREGHYSEAELEEQLQNRGFMNRFYKRATSAVRRPRQMYAVGLLFGLGFDTATEIALLATAGAAAAGGLPIYAVLCLPILFAAGMSLLDTIDGAFMNFAYGWAFAQPVRKIFYNMTITWLSVVVALLIGTIELLSVLADKLSLTGQPWELVSGLDLNYVGYAIAAVFVLTWVRRTRDLAPRPGRGTLDAGARAGRGGRSAGLTARARPRRAWIEVQASFQPVGRCLTRPAAISSSRAASTSSRAIDLSTTSPSTIRAGVFNVGRCSRLRRTSWALSESSLTAA